MKKLSALFLGLLLLMSVRPTYAADLTSVKTVFVILFENHDWSTVKAAPYISSLLTQGAHTQQYYNPPHLHPSEPNYIWLEGGSNFGITNDKDPGINHIPSTAHLTTQLNNAGISWKAYQEDISGTTCPITTSGLFAPKHLGALFFEDVVGSPPSPTNAYCIQHVRPYTELSADLQANNVGRYNFLTPNLCNDMHNCSVATGDTWLSQQIPQIMASDAYKNNGAIFITFDEGAGTSDGPIGMIVLSPLAKKNYVNTIHYDHSSTLRTVQEIFGMSPLLGGAATATDLSDLFDLTGGIPTPDPTNIPTATPTTAVTQMPSPTIGSPTPDPTGPSCSGVEGDTNNDGRVTLTDYEVWRRAYLGL